MSTRIKRQFEGCGQQVWGVVAKFFLHTLHAYPFLLQILDPPVKRIDANLVVNSYV